MTAFSCLAFGGWGDKNKRAPVLCMSFGICNRVFFLNIIKYVWILVSSTKCFTTKKMILFSVKHYMSYLNSTGGAGLVFTESLSMWGPS